MQERLMLVSAGVKTFLGRLKEDAVNFVILKDTMNFLEFNMPGPNGEVRSMSVPIPIANSLPEVKIFPDSIMEVTEDMELHKIYTSEAFRISTGMIMAPNLDLLKG